MPQPDPPPEGFPPEPSTPPQPPPSTEATVSPNGSLGPGRPTRLTPEVHARIVQVVRAGNYLTVAAQFAGVGSSTLQSWLQRGRAAQALVDRGEQLPDTETRYLEFLGAVSAAEVTAEVTAATAWRSRVTEDWRAARDFLRYRVPDRWRAATTVNIRPEEAEQRIETAVREVMLALGADAGTPADLGPDDTSDLLHELTATDGRNPGPSRSRPEPEDDEEP
jgi:hypothetical protein